MEPTELKAKLKGIVDFLITPFEPTDWKKLDEEGLRNNTRFLSKNSVNAMVPCGGIGEITQLTVDEHKNAIKAVVEESGNSLVIPAVQGTKNAIEIAKYAEAVGAEGVLVFSPPWIPFSEEGVYQHVKAIADSVKIGVMIWKSADCDLTAQMIDKLTKISNVVAVKFEPGGNELESFSNLVHEVGHKVAWTTNIHHTGQLASYFYMEGADAFNDAIPNFAPKFDMEMYNALVRADYKKAKEIQLEVAKIARLSKPIGNLTLTKEAMNMVGLAGGSFRPPTIPATTSQRNQIRDALQELKLL